MTQAGRVKLEIEPVEDGNDDTTCTYILNDEDHTLGNALRYIIMKNPDVELCGYAIPHPADSRMNLRIQTLGTSPDDVLRKGLEDLNAVCEHVLDTFENAAAEFEKGCA